MTSLSLSNRVWTGTRNSSYVLQEVAYGWTLHEWSGKDTEVIVSVGWMLSVVVFEVHHLTWFLVCCCALSLLLGCMGVSLGMGPIGVGCWERINNFNVKVKLKLLHHLNKQ